MDKFIKSVNLGQIILILFPFVSKKDYPYFL